MLGLLRGIALLVLACGIVAAQPKAPPTAQQKAEIERLAKRAISKSQAGDHEGAIKDLLEAHAIHPHSANVLLSNVGHEYKQLKKPYEALKYFCMYLDKEPTGQAASYVKAETEVLKKELKLEGETCAQKHFEPVKPEPKPDLTPNPNPDTTDPQVTGTQSLDKQPSGSPGKGLKVAGATILIAGVAALGGGIFYGIKAKQNSDRISQGPPQVDPNCVSTPGMECPRIPWDPADPSYDWPGHAKLDSDGRAFEQRQIILSAAGGAMIVTGTALYFLGRSKANRREVRVAPNAGPNNAGLALVGEF